MARLVFIILCAGVFFFPLSSSADPQDPGSTYRRRQQQQQERARDEERRRSWVRQATRGNKSQSSPGTDASEAPGFNPFCAAMDQRLKANDWVGITRSIGARNKAEHTRRSYKIARQCALAMGMDRWMDDAWERSQAKLRRKQGAKGSSKGRWLVPPIRQADFDASVRAQASKAVQREVQRKELERKAIAADWDRKLNKPVTLDVDGAIDSSSVKACPRRKVDDCEFFHRKNARKTELSIRRDAARQVIGACLGGHPSACGIAADYAQGRYPEVARADADMHAKFLTIGCLKGNGDTCYPALRHLKKTDEKAGAKLLKRACRRWRRSCEVHEQTWNQAPK